MSIDQYTVRRALWHGLKYNGTDRCYDLDAAKMAASLTELVTSDVLGRMMSNLTVDEYLERMPRVDAVVARRMTGLVERVVAAVEAEGLAVPGVEGSINRALDAALHSVNGGE